MRVLLVTWTQQLLEKLSILNPELEYCAIVTDDVKSAKKILGHFGRSQDLIHPFYDLKECLNNFYYDYVFCIENGDSSDLASEVKECGVEKDKLLCVSDILSANNFLLEASLRHCKEKGTKFELFVTGISYALEAIDSACFKHKLLNFANASQDLYYDLKIAKVAVLCGGGHNCLRYALIGLAPYSFHYDLSKTFLHFRMLKYFLAFGDLHNFFLPVKVYGEFFRKEYLENKLPTASFEPSFYVKKNLIHMSPKNLLDTRKDAAGWNDKIFPDTRAENIKILDEYLTLCEENEIRPIVFLPPMSEGYIKHFNKKKLNDFYYLIGLAHQNHPKMFFVDGWNLKGVSDSDFRDCSHLNSEGAKKFSMFLNNVIEHFEAQGE